MTYTLSIEPTSGPAFQHGYHLGTDLKIARDCAASIFNARNSSPLSADHKGRTMATRTVALILNGRIVDVYDGQWQSDYEFID